MSTVAGLVLALIIALGLHLAEEIKTGFRRRLPVGVMPKSVFIGINIGVYTYCFTTLVLTLIGNALANTFQLGVCRGHVDQWARTYRYNGCEKTLFPRRFNRVSVSAGRILPCHLSIENVIFSNF